MLIMWLPLWHFLLFQISWIFLFSQRNGSGIYIIATSSPIQSSPNMKNIGLTQSTSKDTSAIDEQLYSRQIAVYGKSAQQKLLGAHVVIYGGLGSLAAEVLKNLAMAGVGHISIVKPEKGLERFGPDPYLKGSESDLVTYAQSLNSLVKIQEADSLESIVNSSERGSITVICVDSTIKSMVACADKCRIAGAKCIGACVRGVCGLIMDDFLDHFVSDTDGESRKEIPLLSATRVESKIETSSGSISSDKSYQIQLHCIDEDKFIDLGISDTAEVLVSSSGESTRVSYSVRVVNMKNPKTVVVVVDDEATLEVILSSLSTYSHSTNDSITHPGNTKHVTLRKCPSTILLFHKPLREVLSQPRGLFTQSNGCLSPKKDTALSLTLLASFLALDEDLGSRSITYQPSRGAVSRNKKRSSHPDTSLFRTRVLSQLRELGVESPLKPVKLGGIVGADTVQSVVGRFYRSSVGGGVCPATVSVVGSLTAQEAIKSITSVHMPVNQILLFESLDSLLNEDEDEDEDDMYNNSYDADIGVDDLNDATVSNGSVRHPSVKGIQANAAAVYGHELAKEMSHLRLFIVGAGAIGCELLKTLGLMGVGCTTSTTATASQRADRDDEDVGDTDKAEEDEASISNSESSPWKSLRDGGIVVTDMDTIERSNLNRQLLYRERHIGLSKASVASEMIKTINPSMRIHSLTEKVSPDTENTFNSDFWKHVDIVLPALDNVDARLYVDSVCVRHKKWMIDSGTLGTKGSVQVVIPGLSESYASSADPPEDAIPLCTLKSFPYQPEHCIAWARSLFDRLFSEEVSALRTCLEAALDAGSSSVSSKRLIDVCENLTPEIRSSLCDCMSQPQTDPTAALIWARQLFDDLFLRDVQALMREHPVGQLDEDGVPFWSGSRRPPNALIFDKDNGTHRQFVMWAVTLRMKCFGGYTLRPEGPELSTQYHALFEDAAHEELFKRSNFIVPSAENLATVINKMNIDSRRNLYNSLVAEVFEKDDAALGHVDFVGSASNLRSLVYGLRTIDRLEAQRVAGKIVPAVATTTSLVSGLACLELLKIASERVRRRKLAAQTSESNSVGRGSSVKDKESILSWSQSILQYLSRLFQHKHPVGSNTNTNENGIFTISSDSSVEEKERILKKFRNSFVNVARPLLAFSQPVAAETYQCGERTFSMWDTLSMPDPAESLSILTLEGELLERYGVRLQSVTFGDILLYAAFLPDAEYLSSLSLAQLIARTKSRVDNSDSGFTDTRDTNNKADDKKDKSDDDDGNDVSVDRHTDNDPLSATLDMLAQKQFIDIDITCVDEEENEIRLPTVRVKCGLTVLSSDDTDSTQDISVEPKLKYKNKQSKHVHLFESIKELALKLLASFLG